MSKEEVNSDKVRSLIRTMDLPEPATLTDDDLGTLIGAVAELRNFASKYEKTGKAEIEKRLERGDSVNRWYMEEKAGSETVPDIAALWRECCELGVTKEEFFAACKVSLPKLAAAYAEESELSKADARALFRARLRESGLTEVGNPKRYPARIDA